MMEKQQRSILNNRGDIMKSLKKYLGQAIIFGILMTFFQYTQERTELFRYFVCITITYFFALVVINWLFDKITRNKRK